MRNEKNRKREKGEKKERKRREKSCGLKDRPCNLVQSSLLLILYCVINSIWLGYVLQCPLTVEVCSKLLKRAFIS